MSVHCLMAPILQTTVSLYQNTIIHFHPKLEPGRILMFALGTNYSTIFIDKCQNWNIASSVFGLMDLSPLFHLSLAWLSVLCLASFDRRLEPEQGPGSWNVGKYGAGAERERAQEIGSYTSTPTVRPNVNLELGPSACKFFRKINYLDCGLLGHRKSSIKAKCVSCVTLFDLREAISNSSTLFSSLRRALLWYWANIDTISGQWYESLNSVFTLKISFSKYKIVSWEKYIGFIVYCLFTTRNFQYLYSDGIRIGKQELWPVYPDFVENKFVETNL